MPRVLLLMPNSTYRASDFLTAAEVIGVEVVVATDAPSVMAGQNPESLLSFDFRDPAEAVCAVRDYNRSHRINAVIPVDEETAVLAAAIGKELALKHNSVEAAQAARNKLLMAQLLRQSGVPAPAFDVYSAATDPNSIARQITYPCVLKPLFLSGSRGVIRADDARSFVAAWRTVLTILADPEVAGRGGDLGRTIMVEEFIPGIEVAVEGLLSAGTMRVLAVFDKPDPLDGPYFEETLYVTPSRYPDEVVSRIVRSVADSARAIGLCEGPVHAEVRLNAQGPFLIELAARSIGGLCSRALRFGTGMTLEELVLRHALDLPIDSIERERAASGVMMIPIPRAGVLGEVRGLDAARSVLGIDEITISAHVGKRLVPLPYGSSYLGFIFARGATPADVEAALREAHRKLDLVIGPEARPEAASTPA